MAEREAPEILEVPAEMIKNGDTFNIMRLDGLDPMIAWAMGAATGHTAVALWRDGQLQVCESNALSPYWPRNGIQCNPYSAWLEVRLQLDHLIPRLLSLADWRDTTQCWHLSGGSCPPCPTFSSDERSRAMNMTRAWQMVDSLMGVDYGYEVRATHLTRLISTHSIGLFFFQVVLTGLLDTLKDNLPCADKVPSCICVSPLPH